MAKADVYRITDTLDEAALEVMATRLEVRGRHPRFAAMLEEYLDAMALQGGERVTQCGCQRQHPVTWILPCSRPVHGLDRCRDGSIASDLTGGYRMALCRTTEPTSPPPQALGSGLIWQDSRQPLSLERAYARSAIARAASSQ